ncbi:hypothetical protein HYV72_01050 [Candidatus Uhrbacteria bacterium]|nr:hypothetical protein [Candidatus Uhrbacteria bacterium]
MCKFFQTTTPRASIEWVLRIGVCGEFLGHGVLALGGKAAWVEWMTRLLGVTPETGLQIVHGIGTLDVMVAAIILFVPIRLALLWATFWGFTTALARPIMGESFWDFIERFANWAAPLALLLLRGWPKRAKEWIE